MKYMIDMVHHNPGEAAFNTKFLNPKHLKEFGFNGQVFKHINGVVTFAATGIDLFPEGSEERTWVESSRTRIIDEIEAAKAEGLSVIYHIDLIVLPKVLVEAFREEIVDPVSGKIRFDLPKTQELHKIMFKELVECFPRVDGFIIRVGETYLYDMPYHTGNGPIPQSGPDWTPEYLYEEAIAGTELAEPYWGDHQVKPYVELLEFLRNEICVKHDKLLIFRTWDVFPDRLHACKEHYLEVTNQVELHPNLVFSIKHTALDFWRHTKVNECLTQGQHPQIIEVQCQREYEGKGAYPNYVMEGVINGFEENQRKIGLKDLIGDPKILGVYSWSRGGGWYGPYIENEVWPELNAYVLAKYVEDPEKDEENIFREFAGNRLGLSGKDIDRFRELCLLSSRGILKGRHCQAFDSLLGESLLPTSCWMRDDRLGGYVQLAIVLDTLAREGKLQEALNEKSESVEIWTRIQELAGAIDWPPGETGEFIQVSAEYGRLLFRVIRQGWRVLIAGHYSEAVPEMNLSVEIERYHNCWSQYEALSLNPLCPSLYRGDYFSLPGEPVSAGMTASIASLKEGGNLEVQPKVSQQ